MSPLVAVLVIIGSAALATLLMLVARRFAPAGGRFHDTQRASGIFAMVGTAFAVLLAFVILLAFQSFDRAREAAEHEATAVGELYEDSGYLSAATTARIRGDLVCYGRAVVGDEWQTMRSGDASPLVEAWTTRLERDLQRAILTRPQTPVADDIFRSGDMRTEARRQRLTEASPFVPSTVWAILVLGAATVVLFVCLFADPRESRLAQAAKMAAVATIVVSGLVLVRYLDAPFAAGNIAPTAMTRTLDQIESSRNRLVVPPPCDEAGAPRR